MEVPGAMEYGDSIIEGVESENVEEINDAYRDMINEIGTGLGEVGLQGHLILSSPYHPLCMLIVLFYRSHSVNSHAYS